MLVVSVARPVLQVVLLGAAGGTAGTGDAAGTLGTAVLVMRVDQSSCYPTFIYGYIREDDDENLVVRNFALL